MAGVARDLAARMGLSSGARDRRPGGPASDPSADATLAGAGCGPAGRVVGHVVVDDLELCPRFTARVLTGVQVGDSPAWLARRLTAAGMRPINNVVDASNYVMLELGQPTHPYDLDLLAGGGLLVRRAAAGETVTTLDDVVRTLGRPGPGLGDTGQDCLICDATGSPVGIGGIMGGASSEIGPGTTRVLLEAAYFVPMAIARTSKRLNLRTEAAPGSSGAATRPGSTEPPSASASSWPSPPGPTWPWPRASSTWPVSVPGPLEVTVRPARVNGLLGTELSATAIAELLAPLGMAVAATGGDEDPVAVVVPTFRPDIRPRPWARPTWPRRWPAPTATPACPAGHRPWPQPGRLTDHQRGGGG